ncbi:hypothetical protein D9M68_323430 [compost metagenome]
MNHVGVNAVAQRYAATELPGHQAFLAGPGLPAKSIGLCTASIRITNELLALQTTRISRNCFHDHRQFTRQIRLKALQIGCDGFIA